MACVPPTIRVEVSGLTGVLPQSGRCVGAIITALMNATENNFACQVPAEKLTATGEYNQGSHG